ncbi:MAG: thiamine phosphate synthase [bacterium]|nr:thiamine phosphate synthase [Parabacteroides sp.]MDD6080612.1 thiamine phosphate synthase [bacterium]
MIQFITNYHDNISLTEQTEYVLEAGCRWVQLRLKGADDAEIYMVGKALRALCDQYEATLILDDAVRMVPVIGADGVHLGKQDMPVDEARKLLGPDKIIGGTANTFEDVERLARQGANYIGCGPFRFTTTKKNLSPLLGLEGYAAILEQMRQQQIDLPLIAIGGITVEDVPDLVDLGVSGIAISGAILEAKKPDVMMRKFIRVENKARKLKDKSNTKKV